MVVITPRLLVLWDIDHTLLASRGVGREMYVRAVPAAFDRPFVDLADVSGRTELDIIADTLVLHGVEPTRANATRLAEALTACYEAARTELAERGRVLPGAREALVALADDPTVHQAVLTGNLRSVARVKLEAFGLDRYVDLNSSAYGDDHNVRAELVRIAQRRAAERTGGSFDGADTVLIGDTPRDVEAARTAGVRVIAVASGGSGVDELKRVGAEAVLPDLTDVAALKKAVTRKDTKDG
ncbi:phosphoglycolate phosphatase-like HAD superfamily hydrolase [Saccharothrix coeruleofusca]|uniref:HAD family hydrolase n=1 Tax=Saccharothrix coeruleofusca TaxID=33919 RepID=UPI001AE5E749|nr:haloacid dehalogenase-like hydrolase [Saccharothrix coeruleofusca]MBP2336076.1 phosphoglycolate phosphatase-like HAD superfamily hydrolase [Saccharothrix coeruleofusca]